MTSPTRSRDLSVAVIIIVGLAAQLIVPAAAIATVEDLDPQAKLESLGIELPTPPAPVGMASLPMGIAVEIEMVVEFE